MPNAARLPPEDKPAGLLRDGLPPLHTFGHDPCCLSDVEDRVDRVLKEWNELGDIPRGGGRVVAFRDREAPLPVDPRDELVKRDVTGWGPLAEYLKEPGDGRFVLGR